MKDKFFVIYEKYEEWNQFEGKWVIDYEVFNTLEKASGWMVESKRAKDCRQFRRKLIGPLSLSV
jgi:hypothetical protein